MKNATKKPYVYRRAEQLGLRVVEGKDRKIVVVTDDDVVNAKKANSKHCALARAAVRLPDVNAAYVFRSMAYLEYGDRMERYSLPVSVQKEIVSFDRAGIFASGAYQLSPIPKSLTRSAMRKSWRARNPKTTAPASSPPPLTGTPRDPVGSQAAFDARVAGIIGPHAGGRSVSGVVKPTAPTPLQRRTPTRYVHRTQYIRDVREPAK